ncbi:MAG: DUF1059 domain-containing protein [Nitrosopumilus sp.]|nr:DUF1059 domain-containing protein [Nitrosopumilus sp.]
MVKLICRDYGFECGFETSSNNTKAVISEFQKHSFEQHHIEYSEGAMLQLVFQKENRIF